MEKEAASPGQHPLYASAGLRTLLVTDDGNLATTLGRELRTLGHTVVATITTVEATPRRLLYQRPDVLLVDVKFLSAGGGTVLRELHETFVRPLIMVVHESDKVPLLTEADYGSGGMVVMPTTTEQLAVTIIIAVARFLDAASLRHQIAVLRRKLARYRLPRPL